MAASYQRHFVLLEDEGDAGAAVVQVAAVGFTLGLQGRRGVRVRADPPAVAGRREAAEEGVLHALVAAGAGRGRGLGRRGRGLGQEAGPAAAPHLGAAHVSVDALAAVTVLVPAAAVRELQAGVTTRLPQADICRGHKTRQTLFVSICRVESGDTTIPTKL